MIITLLFGKERSEVKIFEKFITMIERLSVETASLGDRKRKDKCIVYLIRR